MAGLGLGAYSLSATAGQLSTARQSVLMSGQAPRDVETVDENADFYVSPQGRDEWSGRKPEADQTGSDGPFAKLARARDAVREHKAESWQDVVVLVRGGVYQVDETVVFGPEDSQRHGYTVRYAAFPGERPVLRSVVKVRGWKRLEAGHPGVKPEARGKVWVADTPALPGGERLFHSLYDGNKRLSRSRSAAFFPIGDFRPVQWRASREARTVVRFPKGALRNWPNVRDVELFLFPTWAWGVNYLGLESVDEASGVARTAIPASAPVGIPLHRYQMPEFGEGSCVAENHLEFLDAPGEWAVDTQAGKIYLWPDGGEPGDDILIPRLTELVRVDGEEEGDRLVRNLVFDGLTFSHGERDVWEEDTVGVLHDWEMWDRANALLRFRNAENCAVRGCRFMSSGGTGVRMDLHCQGMEARDNLLQHLGGSGIVLCGYGPGTKDVNKHNRVEDNHIHHVGELHYHGPAVMAWQSGGNQIRNNLIHHLPYDSIVVAGVRILSFERKEFRREMSPTIRWDEVDPRLENPSTDWPKQAPLWPISLTYQHARNNIIEDNEIFQTMQKLEDGNAIYLSDVGTGNVVRRNYIHHLDGPGWNQAIRTDAWTKGTLITDNLIYNVTGGGINTKYHNNHVLNNVIVHIRDTIRPGPGGKTARIFFGYLSLISVTPRCEVPPHGSTRIHHNILYKTNPKQTYYRQRPVNGRLEEVNLRECELDWNLYFSSSSGDPADRSLERYQSLGVDRNSIAADPLFLALDSGDFRVAPESPAFEIGFQPIDYEAIGLRDTFPAWLKKAVEAELGEDYRDFRKLEAICP